MICFRIRRKYIKREKSVNTQINANNKVLSNIIAFKPTSSLGYEYLWIIGFTFNLCPRNDIRPKKRSEKMNKYFYHHVPCFEFRLDKKSFVRWVHIFHSNPLRMQMNLEKQTPQKRKELGIINHFMHLTWTILMAWMPIHFSWKLIKLFKASS